MVLSLCSAAGLLSPRSLHHTRTERLLPTSCSETAASSLWLLLLAPRCCPNTSGLCLLLSLGACPHPVLQHMPAASFSCSSGDLQSLVTSQSALGSQPWVAILLLLTLAGWLAGHPPCLAPGKFFLDSSLLVWNSP